MVIASHYDNEWPVARQQRPYPFRHNIVQAACRMQKGSNLPVEQSGRPIKYCESYSLRADLKRQQSLYWV
jgi:hypothetical protein